MMNIVAGIDVGKKLLDVSVCESTGGYEREVTLRLRDQGLLVQLPDVALRG